MIPCRLLCAFVLTVGVAACAVPRAGPDYGEITAPPTAALDYAVVRVTAAVASATRVDERLGFGATLAEAAAEDTETIAAGDVLSVTVWESIDQGLLTPTGIGATALPPRKVDERGMIYVPYVGAVRAAGRSVAALREAIRAALAEKTLEPQVDVSAVDPRGRMVSVQGQVRSPGLYPIEQPTVRLLAMLARAGGVAEDPEVIRLKLRRGALTGEIWVQDLYDDPRNNVALRAGDAVIAERDRRLFTALGAVGRQATVPFPVRDLTVERAMGAVGGLIDGAADPTGVFVFRAERPEIAARVIPGGTSGADGRRMVYLIDLTQPGGLFLAREFLMRDGDTLYVTSAPFTRWMKLLQSVAPLVNFSGSVKTLGTF